MIENEDELREAWHNTLEDHHFCFSINVISSWQECKAVKNDVVIYDIEGAGGPILKSGIRYFKCSRSPHAEADLRKPFSIDDLIDFLLTQDGPH